MLATHAKHFHDSSLPPIQVTIVAGEYDVAIRISDQGGLDSLLLWTTFNIIFQGGGLSNTHNQVSKPSDLFSFSHVRNAARLDDSRIGALRTASSSEQGLLGTVDEQVGSWQRAQAQERDGSNSNHIQAFHPRIGIGLPMSYIYATCVLSFVSSKCHSYCLHCSATSGGS